ncbi:16S rRNA (uracil(1498)-N(3))-methyltransferase [Corynebacterium phoceense]|uniref:16S rRNA (uracil(1498)-N(3))-methyltransferase n=1 Tax=Corynebacterium phoceense TaxID=1686286 RepID=UPI00211C9C6B|nr:16S rRNA (uracil(1498)-N(3))-methyltransferase [Corynebacterium phoceense]MCQ9334056.1 16S rRNA (uracil(1498)-N(3))-methyltransferase [Corynebacterium phoceense]
MSLAVFRVESLAGASESDIVELSGPEGRHAVTVKRVEPGERIQLADAAGCLATVTVTEVRGKDALVARVEEIETVPEPDPKVIVIQAIPKSERAELAVDLATQAGADGIIAWQADRCIAKWDAKKAPKALAKWQSAATAAAKQSRRARVPEVTGPLSTAQVAELINGETAYVLHEDATTSLRDVELQGTVYLLIGPEGGIGSTELAKLGATAVKLGPEVVRTASAAMVALAAIGVRTSRW